MEHPGKSSLKTQLESDWHKRCGMFVHNQCPKIDEKAAAKKSTPCQEFGFCVCAGIGRASFLFSQALVSTMRPLFTPPKRRKDANGQIPVETPEAKKLKANRELLVQGMVVVKIAQKLPGDVADDVEKLNSLGPQWAALALSTLRGEPVHSLTRQPGIPSELWVYLGYINFQNWELEAMTMTPVGPPDEQGHQRLEVTEIFVQPSVLYFSKLLDEAAFGLHWDVENLVIVRNDFIRFSFFA